ncbi:MAG: UDP-glucose 4-epimerase GalE [Ahrensia sp.]|nr:UDP-glucose 4-epimerase GalE [Ahrensia sp.]
MKVLLTGGAGYIGSHTYVALKEHGHEIVILDNFSNANRLVLDRLAQLFQEKVEHVEADIRDRSTLDDVFEAHKPDAVIHFAGAKAVGESATDPLKYYSNNVSGSQTLLEAMDAAEIRNIVFSSSATVYGVPQALPLTEDHPLSSTNTYGATKLIVEDMLRALHGADPRWSVAILRYFNPVGAHPSGEIGEDPGGIPNNLMPYITQVAVGRLAQLKVYGDDYDTSDGTGVRDYIHVSDLAQGHVAALKLMNTGTCTPINLGTGTGYSVLDMIKTFERVNEVSVPYSIAERRPGDVAANWADAQRAKELLGWQAQLGIEAMCADGWRWQSRNPKGYDQTN